MVMRTSPFPSNRSSLTGVPAKRAPHGLPLSGPVHAPLNGRWITFSLPYLPALVGCSNRHLVVLGDV